MSRAGLRVSTYIVLGDHWFLRFMKIIDCGIFQVFYLNTCERTSEMF